MIKAENTLDSERLTRDSDGFTAERGYIISGLTGDDPAKLYQAMQTPGLPQYGDPHPVIPDIEVTQIIVEPLTSGSQVRVDIVYRKPDESAADAAADQSGQVTLNTSLVGEEEFRDVNGDLLTATYVDSFGVQIRYFTANVERPQLRVSFKRTEQQIPKSAINNYLGKVNSAEWSGFPPRTWLCSSITAEENAESYDVEYTFVHRAETWRIEVLAGITEDQASQFPIDVETGNGYAVYEVYEQANFNNLGLIF